MKKILLSGFLILCFWAGSLSTILASNSSGKALLLKQAAEAINCPVQDMLAADAKGLVSIEYLGVDSATGLHVYQVKLGGGGSAIVTIDEVL